MSDAPKICSGCGGEPIVQAISISRPRSWKVPLSLRVNFCDDCDRILTDTFWKAFNDLRKRNGLTELPPLGAMSKNKKSNKVIEIDKEQQQKLVMQIISAKFTELRLLEGIIASPKHIGRFKLAVVFRATGKRLGSVRDIAAMELNDLDLVEEFVQDRISTIKSGANPPPLEIQNDNSDREKTKRDKNKDQLFGGGL